MNTLAFWLPLLFLFRFCTVGDDSKKTGEGPLFKKFEGYNTILPSLSGEMIEGVLSVYAQGSPNSISPKNQKGNGMVDSFVLHLLKLTKIPYLIRPAPDPETLAGFLWEKRKMHKILILIFATGSKIYSLIL